MTTRDSYRILGLTSKAGWDEVRRRFRALVWRYHPDRNPENPKAAAQFRRLMEAYETVRAHLARTPQSKKRYYRSRRAAKQEFFDEFFGIDAREQPFFRSGGPDFRYDLRIAFVDALLGLNTHIVVPHLAACHRCNSSGKVPAGQPQTCPVCQGQGRPIVGAGLFRSGPACRTCRGKGVVLEESCPLCDGNGHHQQFRQYRLDIPAGTEDGARLRIAGQGGEGFPGGAPGNLEVVISVAPHNFFTRKGRDLYCQFKVSFTQAALGGEVRVPTLRGHATLNLPKGTQNGHIFRFPGAGAPGGPREPAGDQIIEVVVSTPAHFTMTQRSFLDELARMGPNQMNRAAHE